MVEPGYATEAAAAVRDYWFGMVGAPWLAGFHASQNVASSRVLAKTGFHYDHDTVLHRFDGTEVPCLLVPAESRQPEIR